MRGEVDSRALTPCPPISRPRAAATLRSRSPKAEAAGLNPAQCRCNPDREYPFRLCSPTSRGTELKPRPVQVQTLPRAPIVSEVCNLAQTLAFSIEVKTSPTFGT